jgi:hypothetical protein
MDLAVQLWQRYVSTALMPLAGSSLAVRREMTAFNSQTLSRIEGKVNELMQRTTDGKFGLAATVRISLTSSCSRHELAIDTVGQAEAKRFQAKNRHGPFRIRKNRAVRCLLQIYIPSPGRGRQQCEREESGWSADRYRRDVP